MKRINLQTVRAMINVSDGSKEPKEEEEKEDEKRKRKWKFDVDDPDIYSSSFFELKNRKNSKGSRNYSQKGWRERYWDISYFHLSSQTLPLIWQTYTQPVLKYSIRCKWRFVSFSFIWISPLVLFIRFIESSLDMLSLRFQESFGSFEGTSAILFLTASAPSSSQSTFPYSSHPLCYHGHMCVTWSLLTNSFLLYGLHIPNREMYFFILIWIE